MKETSLNLHHISSNPELKTVLSGSYTVTISNCELHDDKTGNHLLSVEFTLLDPPYAGRKLVEFFRLDQAFSLRRLRALTIAGQHANTEFIANASDLIGKQLKIDVVLRKDREFGQHNVITGFKPASNEELPDACADEKIKPFQPSLTF